MKRGKDEEKVMGPMFPRLHVNDTEKGGPRAPPRNKMALYEQLSIPSQRFKPGMVPIKSDNAANVIPPASSSQGSAQQRGGLFSLQLPPSRQAAEKADSHYIDANAQSMQLGQKKKSEEDDFRVPIFMQSKMGQECGKNCNSADREKLYPCNQVHSQNSVKDLTTGPTEPRQRPIVSPIIRQDGRSYRDEENVKEAAACREQSTKAVPNSSSRNSTGVSLRQNDNSLLHEQGDNTVNNARGRQKTDQNLQPQLRANSHPTSRLLGDVILNGDTCSKNNGGSSISMWDYHSEEQRILDDTESRGGSARNSLPTGIADQGDDTSETSMVDSGSGSDISPDDVVGIIGQKHFWKARRAIINQQRVFAVQVFELHRLIKVQRLIAGSPDVLLEESSYLSKPIKASPAKKLPLEYIVKVPPTAAKLKNDSEEPNHKIEGSAENTVGKTALSSVQNGSKLPSYRQFPVNSPVTAITGERSLGSWCFHQPQGHQWLVPMMSPSEGLVYKPYPGPGFMAPVCGGCGPPGAPPMMGNFLTPAFGVPTSHQYQGMGVPQFAAPAVSHGYFPHGMPVLDQSTTGSTIDQLNHYAASGLHGQPPGAVADSNIQHQASSNLPSQKNIVNVAIPDVMKLHASRNSELQVSTGSSPSERIQGSGRAKGKDGSNVLPLFPTSPVVDAPSRTTHPQQVEPPAQVIKVVPHDGRSATEYAARIFQSIQEERKQYDSV